MTGRRCPWNGVSRTRWNSNGWQLGRRPDMPLAGTAGYGGVIGRHSHCMASPSGPRVAMRPASSVLQIFCCFFEETGTSLDLTLPDHEHLPSQIAKPLPVFNIPCHISFQLWQPILPIGFGQTDNSTAGIGMLMPEAAMHEDYLPPRREYEIWLARQISAMQAVPVTHRMQQVPYGHFGLHALGPDAGHNFTSALRGYGVSHPALDYKASRRLGVGFFSRAGCPPFDLARWASRPMLHFIRVFVCANVRRLLWREGAALCC